MTKVKIWFCHFFHWGSHKKVITFYSNYTHRYYCSKCKHEYDE